VLASRSSPTPPPVDGLRATYSPPTTATVPPRRPYNVDARPRGPKRALEKFSPQAPETRNGRVRHVMGLIASGQWISDGTSVKAIAALWNLSPDTVSSIAQEAWRRVEDVGAADYVKRRLAVALDEVIEEGLEMARTGDAKSLGGFAAVARVFADIAGLGSAAAGGDGIPTFRVELSAPERPTTDAAPAACPPPPQPPGPSSPPDADPARG